ncbi:hypothetical protein Pmar_PMAR020572 [Perkinsus marinus ATCC 50983]|uniref:Pyruvate kinase C-terminal domain-containing protein n=1 Tax=Perkinsus marinus (strain ATCC 50983 / TXsc) TaxID=423536 RepID=C5L7E5_PERM5|nr:hypothetical protein Pmar_PMAR020572 [Perkinsus marinus ATCC 50983]EER07407.1 hypothetical protein Pmar_PMAR020572 [Perkinsus marinus ATCC 50983]|eukprot:XP_002775591.1 hypothetical protein Pmar_PMAR020572 [Perkinsus marinus ATCC 50983]
MAIDSKVEEDILTMVGVADKRVRAMDESAAEACFNSAPTPRLWGKDMPCMKVAASVNLVTIPEENLTEEYFGRLLGGGASIVVLDITKGVFNEAGITQVGQRSMLSFYPPQLILKRTAGKSNSGVSRPFSLALSVGNNELAKLSIVKVPIPHGISAVIIPPVRTGAEITLSRSSALGMKRRRIKIFIHTTSTKNIDDFLPTVDGIVSTNWIGALLKRTVIDIVRVYNKPYLAVITDCSAAPVGNLMAAVLVQSDTALSYVECRVSAADAFSSSPSKSDSVVRLVVERAIAIQRDPGNKSKLIAAFSDDGTTAAMLSRMRPSCKILAMSASEAVVNFFTTLWGVEPLQTSSYQSAEAVIQNVKDFCKDTGLAASGTNLVVVRPIPSTATLEEIDDLDAYVELVEV